MRTGKDSRRRWGQHATDCGRSSMNSVSSGSPSLPSSPPQSNSTMSLRQHLQETVHEVFYQKWTEREGRQIPDDTSVQLGNDAVRIDATVLYADMADSTHLVDNFRPFFAAEIYKSFLACAAKIIRSEGGEITAYDGDRVM